MKSEIKAPEALKSEERELSDAMESMIVLMSRMYRNQVLLALNKSTIDKFADAQTGNYSAVLTTLANRVKRKLMKRFDNKRLNEASRRILDKNDKRSKRLLYERIAKSVAIDPTKLLKSDGMTYDFNALVLETSTWAQKLRDETLEMYTANTLRAMTTGESIESILSQYDGMVEKRKNHAKFTARNQINSFNSIMNKTRAQKLGITKAIWVTTNDERTRESHRARNGKEFDLDKGLYSSKDGKYLLPGIDFSCRCGYRMVLDDENEA